MYELHAQAGLEGDVQGVGDLGLSHYAPGTAAFWSLLILAALIILVIWIAHSLR